MGFTVTQSFDRSLLYQFPKFLLKNMQGGKNGSKVMQTGKSLHVLAWAAMENASQSPVGHLHKCSTCRAESLFDPEKQSFSMRRIHITQRQRELFVCSSPFAEIFICRQMKALQHLQFFNFFLANLVFFPPFLSQNSFFAIFVKEERKKLRYLNWDDLIDATNK